MPSKIAALDEARRFMIDCFMAVKCPKNYSEQMADLLIDADCRGHFSHGMNRLPYYINDLICGTTNGTAAPEIINESPATAWVDGHSGLGAVVGNFCMNIAIQKARVNGVGIVSAKSSTHFGCAGHYSIRAEKQGFIGITMTNTIPIMTPTHSKESALGTNPISFAAPAKDGDNYVLDMATTAVSRGKLEVAQRHGQPLPHGWALDNGGHMTTCPQIALDSRQLLPLGGFEITSGYKGYGLSSMVDILCGVLSGSGFGLELPKQWSMDTPSVPTNIGHFFMVIDPAVFVGDFQGRLSKELNTLRNLPRVDPNKPVLVPGDKSRQHIAKTNEQKGIRYIRNQIEACNKLAHDLKVKPLQFI